MIKRLIKSLIMLLAILMGVAIVLNPGDTINAIKNLSSKDNQQIYDLLDKTKPTETEDTEDTEEDGTNTTDNEYQPLILYKAQVTAAVDGDTFYVLIEGESEEKKIRLIGVNCEESVNPDESKNTQAGVEASNYTKEQLPVGTTVWIQFDQGLNDDYGRWLAYVWIASDIDVNSQDNVIDYMYNAKLVIDGYATPMTIEPNTKYAKLFESLEAIKNKTTN